MICKTCGATHESADFYPSIKTYCKVHWRERVSANRKQKLGQYKAYDRARASQPHRVLARLAYQKTEAFTESHKAATARWKKEHPERRKANNAVNNALRDGRLKKQPCWVCGKTAVAHHPDYERPLDVVWLCQAHHKQAHAIATNTQPNSPPREGFFYG